MLTIHVRSWMEECIYPQLWQTHTKEVEDLREKTEILLWVVLYGNEIQETIACRQNYI